MKKIDEARGKPDRDAIKTMLNVENTILDVAASLDLIDFVEKRELERLKEDRNLAAHPSLRPLGELFTPTTEYARAHLAAAVEALLIHPPSQGRKAVDRFRDHVGDPSFDYPSRLQNARPTEVTRTGTLRRQPPPAHCQHQRPCAGAVRKHEKDADSTAK
ncbi:hypothetical protein ACFYNM_21615 [Streptomyces spororaveus]|uniref:hypothetical protein n=1 Tax=Streptomyces spororaveus TaxID=284039 RepID=UPI0036B6AAC8